MQVSGLGFQVWGLGFQAWGSGFRVWGFGFGARFWELGFRFWLWSFGFGVQGLGHHAWDHVSHEETSMSERPNGAKAPKKGSLVNTSRSQLLNPKP